MPCQTAPSRPRAYSGIQRDSQQELLKHAEDLIHEDQEYLKDFIAAVDVRQE